MFHISRLRKCLIILSVFVAALTLACYPAEAQVKPFKITGGGLAEYVPVVPNVPVSHAAIGNATELGGYNGLGKLKLLGFTSPLTASFYSAEPFLFSAANGDKLAFTYGDTTNGAQAHGHVVLEIVGFDQLSQRPIAIATFVAEFNPIPALCTGRFQKVIGGSFIMVAVTAPFKVGDTVDPVQYTWQGEGRLIYRVGNR